MMAYSLLETFPFAELNDIFMREPTAILLKDGFDFATNTDLEAETILVHWIRSHFPSDAILSEETLSETSLNKDALWIVDPLDGTYNFSLNLPYYGLQLARQVSGKTVFSLIWLPKINLITVCEFDTCKRFELSLNAELIPYQKPKKTHGIPSVSFGDFSKSNAASNSFQGMLMAACSNHFNKVRISGASSVDFGLLCLGISDVHILFSKRPWELIPGLACASAEGLKYHIYECKSTSYTGPCHIVGKDEAVLRVVALCETLL